MLRNNCFTAAAFVGTEPGVPNRLGQITVMPAAASRSAKSITNVCNAGTSWMTITAGPLPRR